MVGGRKMSSVQLQASIGKKRKQKGYRVRLSSGDKVYYTIVYTILILLLIVIVYPLIYIVSASFSSAKAVTSGKVIFFPVDFSLEGYKAVFEYKPVYTGYRNTFFYTIVGTFINVAMTMLAAYPLARKNLQGRGFFTFLFTFTMIFSGGMIPNYMLISDLKMINTVWAMLIPGAIGVSNVIITRTFIQTNIPTDLLEASQIDGCSDALYFFKIVLPLSKAVMSVITLYYAVGHWNAYFSAFLYLNKKELYPLQLFLREILVMNQFDTEMLIDPEEEVVKQGLADLLKYSLIIVSTVPILCVYPFVEKYFEKGVMIGSLKG